MCRCSVPFRESQAAFGWRHRGLVSIAGGWRARQDMGEAGSRGLRRAAGSDRLFLRRENERGAFGRECAVRASTANVEHGVAAVSARHPRAHRSGATAPRCVAAPAQAPRLARYGRILFDGASRAAAFELVFARAGSFDAHRYPGLHAHLHRPGVAARVRRRPAGPRAARALEHARAHGSSHAAAPGALPATLRLGLGAG